MAHSTESDLDDASAHDASAHDASVRDAGEATRRRQLFPRPAHSILTRTGGFLSGFTHSLQPYSGCQFSCRYCYVREMTVQRANPFGLPWSRWLAPKTNAPELLWRTARRGGLEAARIFCSSATDPYTPAERKLGLTRGCLEVMARHPPAALVVQTRSPLVLRDRAVLARIPHVLVSVSLPTVDEGVRRLMEPDSPSVARRLDALARLRRAGLRTQAAVAPVLPGDPAALARALDGCVDRVVVDDFFRGDGAGGRRSRGALERLRAAGYERFAEPGMAAEVARELRRHLGSERVLESEAGFNDLGWASSV
ncbi:MAG: radical SAM protein [Myxococcota bacterium]|nr:radical SAM protein [Myxococcota bacterium]